MELQVKVNQQAGVISSNFDDIKAQVESAVSVYRNVIVTEDTVKSSKKDIADLRKARKEVEDVRKSIKKSFMQPYTEFEDKCKEILQIIDEPIALMESQTKEFEEIKRQEKHATNVKVYEELTAEYSDYLPISKYYKAAWDNVTTSTKSIKDEISTLVDTVSIGVSTIKSLTSDYEDKGLEEFKASLNVAVAIQKIKYMEKQRDEIIERERIKKEKEEQERIRREEEAKRREELRQQEEARKKEEEAIRLEQERIEQEKAAKIFAQEASSEEAFIPEPEAEEVFEPEEAAFVPAPELKRVFNVTYKCFEVSEDAMEAIESFLDHIEATYERVDE